MVNFFSADISVSVQADMNRCLNIHTPIDCSNDFMWNLVFDSEKSCLTASSLTKILTGSYSEYLSTGNINNFTPNTDIECMYFDLEKIPKA